MRTPIQIMVQCKRSSSASGIFGAVFACYVHLANLSIAWHHHYTCITWSIWPFTGQELVAIDIRFGSSNPNSPKAWGKVWAHQYIRVFQSHVCRQLVGGLLLTLFQQPAAVAFKILKVMVAKLEEQALLGLPSIMAGVLGDAVLSQVT